MCTGLEWVTIGLLLKLRISSVVGDCMARLDDVLHSH